MIASQEKSESSVLYSKAVNIPRSGKRSIDYLSPKDDNTLYVNQKPEPPLSFTDSQQSSSLDITNALQRYIQWISFRFLNSIDQLIPQYASWETKLRNLHANEQIMKTVMTYLPYFLLEREMYIPTDFLLASQINKEINVQVKMLDF